MQTFVTLRGDAVAVPIPRRRPPVTPAQARARRHALWLFAHESGLPDPQTGKLIRQSIADLARYWDLPKSTIRDGLKKAIALRAKVREVAAGD